MLTPEERALLTDVQDHLLELYVLKEQASNKKDWDRVDLESVRKMGSRHRICSEAKQRATGAGLTMLGQCPAPAPRARRICLRLLPDTFPPSAGVTAGTPWLTLRSSSSRSKRSWRPWSASGSACTVAAANRT